MENFVRLCVSCKSQIGCKNIRITKDCGTCLLEECWLDDIKFEDAKKTHGLCLSCLNKQRQINGRKVCI